MFEETLYRRLPGKIKMGGQTRNLPSESIQLSEGGLSAVRFNLLGRPENEPGISVNSPLIVVGSPEGNAWIFYLEENHLMKVFSLLGGKSEHQIARMSNAVLEKLRGMEQTITTPFIRGEGHPDKCTRVYILPLIPSEDGEGREIRVLAYHFPNSRRDYLRLNFLRRPEEASEPTLEPLTEIVGVHNKPLLRAVQ